MKKLPSIGLVLDGSYDSADAINLATIALAREYGAKLGRLPNVNSEDYSQVISEMADDAVFHLNERRNILPHCSFFFEDNCLFYMPSIESVRESVDFISSRAFEYPPEDFRGEWLHISDHGNATLYVRGARGKDEEIWGIV